jgi:hypothetical protein
LHNQAAFSQDLPSARAAEKRRTSTR